MVKDCCRTMCQAVEALELEIPSVQYLGSQIGREPLSFQLTLPPLNDIFKVRQRIQNVAINFTVGFARGSCGTLLQRVSDEGTQCKKICIEGAE